MLQRKEVRNLLNPKNSTESFKTIVTLFPEALDRSTPHCLSLSGLGKVLQVLENDTINRIYTANICKTLSLPTRKLLLEKSFNSFEISARDLLVSLLKVHNRAPRPNC